MQTFWYSILHFLTDGLCAFSMFGTFRDSSRWALLMLLYNFCAFVLQALFGGVLDALSAEQKKGQFPKADLPAWCSGCGILCTVLGAFLHPALLGIGNALFHVGGGVGTIRTDREKKKGGQLLGIFVAPGALGLFLGTWAGKLLETPGILTGKLLLSLLLPGAFLPLILRNKQAGEEKSAAKQEREKKLPAGSLMGAIGAAVLCFLVVVLRSYIGMAVSFSWKTGFFISLLCTAAVVLGKMAGGILAARYGALKVMLLSLPAAALGYFLSEMPYAGIAGLFFFNMTMPVTLYLITERFPELPGFSFGLLTIALFLGYLPVFFGASLPLPGPALGGVGSILSLALLVMAVVLLRRGARKGGTE